MKLQTPVEILPIKEKITYQSKLLFIGSCFATEIGKDMINLGFDILLNPFGVLYNPISIANSIDRLTTGKHFKESDIICSQGQYTSFFHHSSFSRSDPEEFLTNANSCLDSDRKAFEKCDWCIVTLGTAWVFRHIERNIIVSNCHKILPNEFRRERLNVEQTVETLSKVIAAHPDKKWIFTVSPIRHLKDGAHGNQLSKATLLLAIEILQHTFDNVYYFPAYEIMMDELRD